MPAVIDEKLLDRIYECLLQNRDGISEYELLKQLSGENTDKTWSEAFADRLSLFKAHFLLFNALYRLRNRLLERKLGRLEINPLNMRLQAYQEGEAAVDAFDALMEYYLDFANLDNTTAREVDDMLANFHLKCAGQDKRRQALQILGLRDPVDDHTIKQQYRRLAMEHHPDRGGDKETLQKILSAVRLLIP